MIKVHSNNKKNRNTSLPLLSLFSLYTHTHTQINTYISFLLLQSPFNPIPYIHTHIQTPIYPHTVIIVLLIRKHITYITYNVFLFFHNVIYHIVEELVFYYQSTHPFLFFLLEFFIFVSEF
eukprot:UN02101